MYIYIYINIDIPISRRWWWLSRSSCFLSLFVNACCATLSVVLRTATLHSRNIYSLRIHSCRKRENDCVIIPIIIIIIRGITIPTPRRYCCCCCCCCCCCWCCCWVCIWSWSLFSGSWSLVPGAWFLVLHREQHESGHGLHLESKSGSGRASTTKQIEGVDGGGTRQHACMRTCLYAYIHVCVYAYMHICRYGHGHVHWHVRGHGHGHGGRGGGD